MLGDLSAGLDIALGRAEVKAKLMSLDQYPFTGTPDQFQECIHKQSAHWAGIIQTARIVLK